MRLCRPHGRPRGALARSGEMAAAAGTKSEQIEKWRDKYHDARKAAEETIAEYKKKAARFWKEDMPTVAKYGGAGALLGLWAGSYLYDKMAEWFGADSYLALYGTAALGVVVVAFAPKIVRGAVRKTEQQGPAIAALSGFGVGLAGIGAWRAWQDYSATNA
ncbi:hypothetical protein [Nannocystis bainbridge]|uniref:Holin of 3TMs, for gene-transfer release n=1 Tax=Nannocystis bainbridge TaxID=2995303 RepID=A0ABT5E5P6_9BACT|nr:hypothetical protein [Nannocystis bainbridge]MDC0720669.1 hypothetical protein [Nannocystis bainbridge]